MAAVPRKKDHFRKHHFRAGLECVTKLYYKSESYPENRQSRPFIEHAAYNKRLLKSLLRSAYPGGTPVSEESAEHAFDRTRKLLGSGDAVLFDAVFLHRGMMARLPVVEKAGNEMKVYHVQTKAFNRQKHTLVNSRGKIYPKWENYLLQFAFQLHLIRRNYPDIHLTPLLVLPDRSGVGGTDNLHYKLYGSYEKGWSSVEIPASEQNLLVKIDAGDQIDTIWNGRSFADEHFEGKSFEEYLEKLRHFYKDHIRESPAVGSKCKQCEFRIEGERKLRGAGSGFDSCWSRHLGGAGQSGTPPHVFDLIGPGTGTWIERGIYDQREIPPDEITAPEVIRNGKGRISEKMRQMLQIAKAKGAEVPPEIIRPRLLGELRRWSYPIHFLDFEAGNYAVPVREDRNPYHLVVFQFSCHTLFRDGRRVHHEWLDDQQSGYPGYELVRRLRRVPFIEEGTIVQYSNFERNALKTIRRELAADDRAVSDAADLTDWIENIIGRNDSGSATPPYIADLSRLVKHYYYNDRMLNSLSIKDVLQSVLSYSALLRRKYSEPYSGSNFDDIVWWQSDGNGQARNPYRILAESGDLPVRRGTEAMVVYGKMISRDLDPGQESRYRSSLLKYCELDTLAMAMIFEHWRQKIDD